jgi:type IV secretion system protein TrbI
MPNGAEIPLPKAPAADTEGYPGLEDQVDNHHLHVWGPAMLIAAITAGTALAETPTYGGYQGYNAEQYALGAGAASLGGMAKSRLASSLNTTKPTITIRPGYLLRVLVNRDMTFEGAYRGS